MAALQRTAAPVYQRIADDLRGLISAGELVPGAQLPTEHELSGRYGASRYTVRQSVALLVAEGLVVSRRPHGHFVRERRHFRYRPQREFRPQPVSPEMDRFMAEVTEEGRTPAQTIDVALIQATQEIAKRLDIDEGALVVVRRRVRSIDNEPFNINDSYYPFTLVEGSEIVSPADIARGCNQVLTDLGYEQDRTLDEIYVRMPTPTETNRLGLGPGTPVAVHICTGFTEAGQAVRCTVNVLPGDRHVIAYERHRVALSG